MSKYDEHDPSSMDEDQPHNSNNKAGNNEQMKSDDDEDQLRYSEYDNNQKDIVKSDEPSDNEPIYDAPRDFLSEQTDETDYSNDRFSDQNDEQPTGNEPLQRSSQREDQKKQRRNRWLTPVLLGVIIGILLTTVALPVAIDSGLIPESFLQQTQTDEPAENSPSESERPPAKNQSVSLDVTSQITEVVDEVSPAVVGVTNIQQQADFWRQESDDEAGTGSGVIYKATDDSAYIITNHHVVEHADVIEVVLSDETTVEADLLGSDIFTDLAVLQIDESDIGKVIERGSSDQIKVGEPAIAIGNPLGHMFSGSVTQGVISGTQRTIPIDLNQDGRADWQAEVIQTDAAVNPGNSGGALINIDGQLIGINSMKINQNAVEGMAFAIPIDSAWPIVEELEETGEVTRPHMGVEIYSLDEVPKSEWSQTLELPNDVEGGVYIWSVERLSPAEQAGLNRLDVITELDGKEILGTIDLRKILYQQKDIGDEIDVIYYRDGEKHETTLTLETQQ